jgi:hypothetical protein
MTTPKAILILLDGDSYNVHCLESISIDWAQQTQGRSYIHIHGPLSPLSSKEDTQRWYQAVTGVIRRFTQNLSMLNGSISKDSKIRFIGSPPWIKPQPGPSCSSAADGESGAT